MPRARATCVVLRGDQVLLIKRHRDDRNYFVVPGGGIEPGETPEQACLRELDEETSLRALRIRHIEDTDEESGPNAYFLISDAGGTPRLGGPEAVQNCPTNRYELRWTKIDDLDGLPLRPSTAREVIMKAYRLG